MELCRIEVLSGLFGHFRTGKLDCFILFLKKSYGAGIYHIWCDCIFENRLQIFVLEQAGAEVSTPLNLEILDFEILRF